MIRLSALRNTSVICSGKHCGLLQDIVMDEEQKKVEALTVSCGIHGKRIVNKDNVASIANGFILVHKTEKYHRASVTNSRRFLRDTMGLLVGRISDYALEECSLRILAIEMQTGYIWNQNNKHIWIYDYRPYDDNTLDLVIPASLGSELIISEEGNDFAYVNDKGDCCGQPAWHYDGRRPDDDASGKTHEESHD